MNKNELHFITNSKSEFEINTDFGSVVPNFKPLLDNEGNAYVIEADGYFYRVNIEVDKTVYYDSLVSKTNPNKTTFKPYDLMKNHVSWEE